MKIDPCKIDTRLESVIVVGSNGGSSVVIRSRGCIVASGNVADPDERRAIADLVLASILRPWLMEEP